MPLNPKLHVVPEVSPPPVSLYHPDVSLASAGVLLLDKLPYELLPILALVRDA